MVDRIVEHMWQVFLESLFKAGVLEKKEAQPKGRAR